MSLASTVAQVKAEVSRDITDGVVPSTITSFAELHDYVDANGYGGAFEEGAPSPNDPIWDAVQERVDRWLKRGRR